MWFAYFIFLLSYFIIDMVWITISSKYHKGVIENIQKSPLTIDMVSGTIYYVVLSFLLIYALSMFTKTKSDWLLLGFLIALSMFLTFDITNKTIFKEYPYWYVAFDVTGGVSSIMLALLITSYFAVHG